MGSLGMQEIVVIFVLALIVFGPRKLPELGKSLGRGLAEFKKASNELKQTWEEEVRLDKEREAMADIMKETNVSKELKQTWEDVSKDDSNVSKELKQTWDDVSKDDPNVSKEIQ
jgi:TatA/E family protein of Tat protein translocase